MWAFPSLPAIAAAAVLAVLAVFSFCWRPALRSAT
jgi:hypothetical protein